MAQFQPKRWQVEDRCGLCNVEFSLMNTRHHCRSCGRSVCGKHSRNKVIVPTSLSKVPQRVCDKCYPKCRNVAMGLAPPPRRDLPEDKPRRHTLEERDHRRDPREGARRTEEAARRDNRTWNGADGYDERRRMARRDGDQSARERERRMRSPRAKSPHAARSPHGRDPREVVSTRNRLGMEIYILETFFVTHGTRNDGTETQEKETRERENAKETQEREIRVKKSDAIVIPVKGTHVNVNEIIVKENDVIGTHVRENDVTGLCMNEICSMALHRPRDSPQKERRRMPNTEPNRNRKHEQMRSPVPSLGKRSSGKARGETESTCRTTSSTLSNLYAAINASEEIKNHAPPPKPNPKRPSPRKEENQNQSAFADSTFSIFSLAGSDHESQEAKARDAAIKKKAVRRPKAPTSNVNRESMEKKEHLDFSASSSSVKSFEVSAITQKYLRPKPAKAAMQKTTLKPMIEEDSEEESTRGGPSRRKAAPQVHTSERKCTVASPGQRKHTNKVRGETLSARKMMPPFRRDKRIDASFRDSSELLRERGGDDRKLSSQNSGTKSSRTSSISDGYDGFKETQTLLGGDNSFSDDDDEAFAKLLAASNRGKQDLTAKRRAKKLIIAGIDSASLEAKEKAPITANYKLTRRDQEIMRQISDLEAVVIQHQKELPDLLDMYSEANKRSQKARKELQKAKVRVARYEKAHAAVSRAIRSGKLYIQQKEYMAAILELSRATGIERSNATLWYLLAECRLMVCQPAAAEEACMTSLKLQPTGAAVAMLGRIMQERGRHDEAIECYLSALGRNDESEDEEESE
ncbi:LOW QUALITY PROTEIN: hypothetical protein PHMEG_00016172 [Phytophthora megakarya]|uniref:FYVE-type domain-containing protein n=1 Tax=Phytophthora megakarya TaxID=4795 RepID=A0A225W210_9STRA|nr:LOW QUALITY PROTEIN: hypothetical protein PHMEG_00016172 [Phytophthora megakarya]